MYKICLQNSIKFNFPRGTAPDPAGGAYSAPPPDPQLDFVPTNQVGQTGYFMAATTLSLCIYEIKYKIYGIVRNFLRIINILHCFVDFILASKLKSCYTTYAMMA